MHFRNQMEPTRKSSDTFNLPAPPTSEETKTGVVYLISWHWTHEGDFALPTNTSLGGKRLSSPRLRQPGNRICLCWEICTGHELVELQQTSHGILRCSWTKAASSNSATTSHQTPDNCIELPSWPERAWRYTDPGYAGPREAVVIYSKEHALFFLWIKGNKFCMISQHEQLLSVRYCTNK